MTLTNKKTVLLIGDPPSERFHSMEIYAEAMERALRKRGEFEIKRFRWRDEPPGRGKIGRTFNLYCNRFVRYPGQLAGARADIYHILDHSYAHLIRRLAPQRTVITCHDLIPLDMQEYCHSIGKRLCLAAFRHTVNHLKMACHIIADSQSTKNGIISHIGCQEKQISVIPLGIDDVFFQSVHKSDDSEAPDKHKKKLVLQIGATREPYKNVANILRAFKALSEQDAAVSFTKVGLPYTAEQQDMIARLGLSSKIDYLGFVPGHQLPAVYRQASVLVVPSLTEGFGLPILEAMACGTPVVTTRRGSIPEVAGDAAVYVDPLDPLDIAGGIEKLLNDERLFRKMSQKGRARADEFRWSRTAEHVSQIYRSIF